MVTLTDEQKNVIRRKAIEKGEMPFLIGPPLCPIPPDGWLCTREVGHPGPCAAIEEPQPVAWIIERRGSAPTMTHYKTVADSQRSMGAIVTPYCSQF